MSGHSGTIMVIALLFLFQRHQILCRRLVALCHSQEDRPHLRSHLLCSSHHHHFLRVLQGETLVLLSRTLNVVMIQQPMIILQILGISDPLMPLENLFQKIFLGGVMDQLQETFYGKPEEENADIAGW